MARRKCGTRRKRRSGGAEIIDPAPYPAAVMAEGRQPSNAIMDWATTAGIPAPAKMSNVAHGGKRRTRRKRSMKRSTRRMKRRGGDCGCAIRP